MPLLPQAKHGPRYYLGKFHTDCIVHDDEALRLLNNIIGTDKIVMGTDYPFPLGEVGTPYDLAPLPPAPCPRPPAWCGPCAPAPALAPAPAPAVGMAYTPHSPTPRSCPTSTETLLTKGVRMPPHTHTHACR